MAQVVTESASRHATITAEVIRDVAAFRAIREEWTHLFDRAYNAAPTLSHEWLSTWLDIFGHDLMPSSDPLRIICCRRGGDLVAAIPLYIRRPQRFSDGGYQLRFISTGEFLKHEICPDYMDLLSLADVRESCAELVWRVIAEELRGDYDRLDLTDVADTSTFLTAARVHGADYDIEISPRGVCPIADLSGGLDAYLARLSANTRQQGRRLLRAAAQAGVVFEVAKDATEVERYMRELIQLHQERWNAVGQPGCFSSQSFKAFHDRLLGQWHSSGKAIITRLRLGDRTLAVKYGFRVGSKYDFYQSGVLRDEGAPIKSPGVVSFLLLMQYLSAQGVTAFDFLRGSSNYKQRLATTVQPLVQVRLVLWSWRTAAGFVSDLAERSVRKAIRVAFGRRTAGNAPAPE